MKTMSLSTAFAVLTLGIAGCKTVVEPDGAPMRQSRVEQQTTIESLHDAPALAVLRPNLTKGRITVNINGTDVGTMGVGKELDVVKYLKPGSNMMTLRWTRPVSGLGRVEFGTQGSTLRHLVSFTLPPHPNEKRGQYRINFDLPADARVGESATIIVHER